MLYNLTSTRFRNSLCKLLGLRRSGQSLSRTSSLHPAELCATAALTLVSTPSNGTFRRSWHGRSSKTNCTVVYKLDKRFIENDAISLKEKKSNIFKSRKSGAQWKYRFTKLNQDHLETNHYNFSLSTASTDSTTTLQHNYHYFQQQSIDTVDTSCVLEYPSTFTKSRLAGDVSVSCQSSPLLQHSAASNDTTSLYTVLSTSNPQLDSVSPTISKNDVTFKNNLLPASQFTDRRLKRASSSSPNIFHRHNSSKSVHKSGNRRGSSMRGKSTSVSNTNSPFLGRSTALTGHQNVYGGSGSLSPPQVRYSMRSSHIQHSTVVSHKESYV